MNAVQKGIAKELLALAYEVKEITLYHISIIKKYKGYYIKKIKEDKLECMT